MNCIALLIILAFLISFFIIGSLVMWAMHFVPHKDVFFDLFVRLMIGMVSVVTGYAIVKTRANTILWGFVIIGLFAVFSMWQNKSLKKDLRLAEIFSFDRSRLIALPVSLLLVVVFFLFQGCFFYHSPINNMPHGDYTFYATVTGILDNFGVETSDWESVIIYGTTTPTPYHYFDIWLPTMIYGIIDGDIYESFVVITQTLYMTVLTIGTIALTRKFTASNIMQILSVLSVFFAGLLFVRILPQASDFIFSNSCSLKFLSVSLFVVWCILIMLEKNNQWFLPLLCLPIVNVVTAPVTFITIVLLFCLSVFRTKNLKTIIFPFVSIFIVASCIVIFYFGQAGETASGGLSFATIVDSFANDKLKPFKIILGAIAILVSIYFYYLLPTMVSVISCKRKEYFALLKDNAIVFITMFISLGVGIGVWGLTHVMADSMQFFIVFAIPWINISLWLLILFAYKVAKGKLGYLVGAFVVLLAAMNFYQIEKVPFYRYYQIKSDVEYVKNVSAAISETAGGHLGIFLQDSSEMKGYWDFNRFGVGDVFKHFTSDLYLTAVYPEVNIDTFKDIDKSRIQKMINSNPFQQFMSEYKSEHSISSYEEIILEFIKKYNCRYIYLSSKCELPENLKPYINALITDSKTKERVAFLKPIMNLHN